MGKAAVAIELSGEERRELEELAGRRRTARRARIVLLAAERVLEAFKRRKPLFVEKVRDVASGSTCVKNWYSDSTDSVRSSRASGATRMIARYAHSPSSPAPSARRYAASGLDRPPRPSREQPCQNGGLSTRFRR